MTHAIAVLSAVVAAGAGVVLAAVILFADVVRVGLTAYLVTLGVAAVVLLAALFVALLAARMADRDEAAGVRADQAQT